MAGRACRLDVSQHFSGSQNEPKAFLYGLPHNGKRLTDSGELGNRPQYPALETHATIRPWGGVQTNANPRLRREK